MRMRQQAACGQAGPGGGSVSGQWHARSDEGELGGGALCCCSAVCDGAMGAAVERAHARARTNERRTAPTFIREDTTSSHLVTDEL